MNEDKNHHTINNNSPNRCQAYTIVHGTQIRIKKPHGNVQKWWNEHARQSTNEQKSIQNARVIFSFFNSFSLLPFELNLNKVFSFVEEKRLNVQRTCDLTFYAFSMNNDTSSKQTTLSLYWTLLVTNAKNRLNAIRNFSIYFFSAEKFQQQQQWRCTLESKEIKTVHLNISIQITNT